MPFFYIRTNRNCTRRNADSQRIYDYLTANGWSFTKDIPRADLIVICTCAATDISEYESVYNISRILTEKSELAKVIITGCLPPINREKIDELGDFAIVNPREMEDFDRLIKHQVSIGEIFEHGIIVVPDFERPVPSLASRMVGLARRCLSDSGALKMVFRRRAVAKRRQTYLAIPSYDIRIVKGCLGNCSYCCIRFAVGRLESKPPQVIRNEFRDGLEKGFKVLTLVGVDTGCYGLDIGTDIAELLKQIFAVPGDYGLRIDDFNPQWLVKYYDQLIPLFIENRNRFIEIAIPLQSGSNRILKLMKRPYDIDVVRSKLDGLKEKMPELRIRTHMLVGFPGETQEDYEKTRRLVQEFDFADVTIFRYADRPRTASSQMDGKLPASVKVAREEDLWDTFAGKQPADAPVSPTI